MARARMKIRNRGIGFVHGFVEAGIMFRNSDSLEVFVGNFFSHIAFLFSCGCSKIFPNIIAG